MTPDNDKALRAPLDPRTRTALASVGAFGVMFAITGAIAFTPRTGASILVGTVIAMLNLYGLAKILGAFLGGRVDEAEGKGDSGSGIYGLFAFVKVFVLFGGVWLLMSAHLVDPVPMVVGWASLPVGIAVGSLLSDKSDRSPASRAKEAPRK